MYVVAEKTIFYVNMVNKIIGNISLFICLYSYELWLKTKIPHKDAAHNLFFTLTELYF